MNLQTMPNHYLTAALHAAMAAVKETRGSANLKRARRNALAELKAEAARRMQWGAW